MKKLLHKIIKIFLIILLCLFAGVILLISYGYMLSFDKSTLNKIKSDPAVSDVHIWIYETSGIYADFNMDITFIDDGRIGAFGMDKWGKATKVKGKLMSIHVIDEYYISFFNKTEKEPMSANLEAWSAVTGVQLENIVDVVRNYPVIRKQVESWTDLSDYKQDGEVHSETRNRVIALNQYSDTVMQAAQNILMTVILWDVRKNIL